MITIIIISALAVAGLFAGIFGLRKVLLPLVFVGLLAAAGAAINDWNTSRHYFNEMMIFDNYAIAFSVALIGITFLWFMISLSYFKDSEHETDYFSLILFALTGAVTMVSFGNMIMLFLGIEIISIAMYILAGSNKMSLASNEASLKYFLMGAFSTGFLLFGIALIYGATGSFNLSQISTHLASNNLATAPMLFAGILLMMIALTFKVSAAPFHFWAPDVYTGAPTVITAFMSTVVKTAAFAAFLRLFMEAFVSGSSAWNTTLSVICGLTILIGNITAVSQNNVKRMLAYSSVAHAGYMLLAIIALNSAASSSLLFYTIAYSVSSIASFGVLMMVSKATGSESIESFYGLARKNPLIGIVVVITMLSLAGIPPTAGFFAKYYIFSAALENGHLPLVLIAVLGSLVGVYYYFKVIIALFRDQESGEIVLETGYKAALIITSVVALLLGLAPGLLAGKI